MPPPSKKANSLSIRLVESAVYLRSSAPQARRRRGNHDPDSRTSVLRGLLVLDLVKPTKITSIDVELVATTDTAWPEGTLNVANGYMHVSLLTTRYRHRCSPS